MVGSKLALWEVALVPDPSSPEVRGQLCIMLLPNSTHIALEDIPSLAFRRSSQDVPEKRRVAFPVPSPSRPSAPLCLTSLPIPNLQGRGHTSSHPLWALAPDTGERSMGSLSSWLRLLPTPFPQPSPLSPCTTFPAPSPTLPIGVTAVAQTMRLY